MSQHGDKAQNLGSYEKNRTTSFLICFRIAETPGFLNSQIFIGGGDNRPNCFECPRKFKLVVVIDHRVDSRRSFFDQGSVAVAKFGDLWDFPAKTAVDHGGGAAGKIA